MFGSGWVERGDLIRLRVWVAKKWKGMVGVCKIIGVSRSEILNREIVWKIVISELASEFISECVLM